MSISDEPGGDEDTVLALEREVTRRRERLTSTLQSLRTELHDEVSELTSWRHWYERHPLGFLAGAALAGWTVGLILSPPRR